MAKKKKEEKIGKKTLRLELVRRMENTFGDLQETLGDRLFKRNLKKASKALTNNIKPINLADRKLKAPASGPLKRTTPATAKEAAAGELE